MLLTVAILALAACVLGQVPSSNVTCQSGLDFLDNHIHQNPCLVTAYLFSACDPQHPFSVNSAKAYPIPGISGLQPNLCTCSTVSYMTLSACGACQGNAANPPWTVWKAACNASDVTLRNFSLPIPQGTAVPAWAYHDLVNDGFDLQLTEVFVQSGNPEPDSSAPPLPSSTSPSAGTTSTSTDAPVSSSAQQSDAPPPNKKSSHVGAIVGGVIGGLAALLLGSLALWFILRRTRPRAIPDPPLTETSFVGGHKTVPSQGSERSWWPNSTVRDTQTNSPVPTHFSPASTRPLKLYDPDDPSTFPPPLANHANIS